MNINKVNNLNFSANKIQILRNLAGNTPKEKPLLNNYVLDLVKKHSMTSVFKNEGIDVTNPSKEFLEELIEKGIKYITEKKL